jgi:hypothetical protein
VFNRARARSVFCWIEPAGDLPSGEAGRSAARVAAFSQSVLAGDVPVVLAGLIESWPARGWSTAGLGILGGSAALDQIETRFAFHPRPPPTTAPADSAAATRDTAAAIPWETNCRYVSGTFAQFADWLAGNGADGPFAAFHPEAHWG